VVALMIKKMESLARRISNSITGIETFLSAHPFFRVAALVMSAMILFFGTQLASVTLAPWAFSRVSLLYLRFDELLVFFAVMFCILVMTTRVQSAFRFERAFFRCVVSLTLISLLWTFISFSEREFALYALVLLAGLFVSWSIFGTHVKIVIAGASVVIALILIPFDIAISSPFRSTEGRQASVQLLEAQYGLVRETTPGTYSMGCVVPPNPVAWVLWIDLWPIVDQAFIAYDNFFNSSASSLHRP
jgi:hypothetical protein